MNDFYKFPSTPHLLPATNMRDDKIIADEDKKVLLSNQITIEEKIDGANLGISFSHTGEIILQNRGSIIERTAKGQWIKLSLWLSKHESDLFDSIGSDYILFGEWCYAMHSIHYNKLPDWFIAFDVFDKVTQKYMSVSRRNELVRKIKLTHVPLIATGKFSINELKNMKYKSRFGDSIQEGIYLRYDEDGWLKIRAKLVENNFSQAIGDHWSKRNIIPNKLINNC